MLALKRRAVACALAAAATLACNANDISFDAPEPDPVCPGCVFSALDNPVLGAHVQLLSQAGVVEVGTRPDDDRWRFDRFRVDLGLGGGNAAHGSDPDASGLQIWPAQRGTWAPSVTGPAELPWEVHGVRVGYDDLTVSATKLDTSYARSTAALPVTVRLAPDVILVPIQVARMVPESASEAVVTAQFDEPGSEVLLDDRWQASLTGSSQSGQLIARQGAWTRRRDLLGAGLPDDYAGQRRPDPVFAQCHIQLRLIRHVEVTVDAEHWNMTDPTGDPACGLTAAQLLRGMRSSAVTAGLSPSLPILMFVNHIMNPACPSFETRIEEACEPDSCADGAGWAAITPQNLTYSPFLIDHALGHVLGLNDLLNASAPDVPHPLCASSYPQPNLMCGYASEMGPYLSQTDPGAGCAVARHWAAVYSNAYYGTTFTG